MFNTSVEVQHPRIKRFFVNASSYTTGYVAIVFREPQQDTLQNLLSKAKETIHPELFQVLNPEVLLCVDMVNAEKIYEALKALDLLTDKDRSNIAGLLEQVKKRIAQRSRLDYQTNPGQNTVLMAVDEVYIDDILENCKTYENAVFLFRAVFIGNLPAAKEKILSVLKTLSIDVSVFESIEALSKIICGEANLEMTLTNMGHLPKIISQRNTVFTHCIKKLGERFQELDDFNQLFMYVGLLMARSPGQEEIFINFKEIIVSALRNITPVDPVFSPDVMVLTSAAFSQMQILRKEGPDFVRIDGLVEKFNSPVLKAYSSKLKIDCEPETNPLLLALQSDDPVAFNRAVESGQSLSQVFRGRTPLIYAVQSCSVEMVRTVLAHKPDVNALSPSRLYRPIGGPISLKPKNPLKLKLLLDAGANPFLDCGGIKVVTPFFQAEPQFRWATPLELALEEYRNEKTPETEENVKLLLAYGAALNYPDFPLEACHLLTTETLAIGAGIPREATCKPITTVEEFKARIPREKYPHYMNIMVKARAHFLFRCPKEIIKLTVYLVKNQPSGLPKNYTKKSTIKFTIAFQNAVQENGADIFVGQLVVSSYAFLKAPVLTQAREYLRDVSGHVVGVRCCLEILSNEVDANLLKQHAAKFIAKFPSVLFVENEYSVTHVSADVARCIYISKKIVQLSQEWDVRNLLSKKQFIFEADVSSMTPGQQQQHKRYDNFDNIISVTYEYAEPNIDIYNLAPPVHEAKFFEEALILNSEQNDYLAAIDEMFTDVILEKCKTYEQAVILCRAALCEKTLQNKSVLKGILGKFRLGDEVFQAIVSLSEVVYVKTALTEQLLARGKQPSTVALCDAVQHHCFARICKKFSNLADVDSVFLYLGLRMMVEKSSQDPFGDFKSHVLMALKGGGEATLYFPRGVREMMRDAIRELRILGDENSPSLDRLNALAGAFDSPVMREYLEELKKSCSKDKGSSFGEDTLLSISSGFFAKYASLSPKVWRKHPAVPTTQFVLFKPTDKKVAQELTSTLSENGLHAYVSEGKDSKVAVYVNFKK